MASLTFVVLAGFWYFRRWDNLDKGFLVYAKPESDRKQFLAKHDTLMELYKMDSNARVSWQDERRRGKAWSFTQSLVRAFRAGSNTGNSKRSDQSPGSSNSSSPHDHPPVPTVQSAAGISAGGKGKKRDSLLAALVGVHSARANAHMKYEVLFDTSTDQAGERALYVSNVVANFLDSVMPEDSLQKNSETSWAMFLYTVLRYHEYTAMFFGSSLKFTRTLRWTNITIGFLLNLFFDTLFYGIFYPDEGTCEGYSSETSCLTEQSKVSNARLCSWTADAELKSGGSCTLNPPPTSFVFLIIVVLCTVVISVPVQFCYDFILFQFCMRRPRLEDWGLTSEFWLGRATQQLTGHKKENQESPIQVLYNQVDNERRAEKREEYAQQYSGRSLEKHMQEDDNFKAQQMYESYMSAEHEANTMLRAVQDFLDVYANAPKVPWHNSKYSILTQAKANAIQKYVGIYPDSRPVPLSVLDRLLYGTPKNKLVRSIEFARRRSAHIQDRLREFGDGELQNRDTMLIQYFILEQFSKIKRFVLHRHMFDFSVSTPQEINPFCWLLAWTFVLLSIAFFLYWGFIWGVSQAGSTVQNWGINIGTSLAQDVLVVQVFRVYIIYTLSMVSIKPQLQFIYRVLNKVAISYAQDELDGDYLDIRVCQHLSPACRTAHSHIASNLATANILRHIDDADVAVCRLKYDVNMATVAAVAFTLPLLISILNQTAGDVILESLLPAVLDAALIMNYYFYAAAGLFILMPYLAVIGAYIWKHKIHKPSRKLLSLRQQTERSVEFVKHWNEANRKKTGRSTVVILQEQMLVIAFYLTRPVMLLRAAYKKVFGRSSAVADNVWARMNLPAAAQGLITDVPMPVPDYSLMARLAEIETDRAIKEDTRSRIPQEVSNMLCTARVSWYEAWNEAPETLTPAQRGVTSRDAPYLITQLTYALTHTHRPHPEPSVPLQRPARPLQHSDRVVGYLEQHRILTNPEAVVAHLLRSYRRHVSQGRMSLVDPEEIHALYARDTTKCDVLVEFFDLRILLEEALSVYQPLGVPLTAEERDEIVDSCYMWLYEHADSFLEEHYHTDTHRIAAATLQRLNSSLTNNLSTAAPVTDVVPQSINFSAPFQQVRLWFLATAVTVERYRENQLAADVTTADTAADDTHT